MVITQNLYTHKYSKTNRHVYIGGKGREITHNCFEWHREKKPFEMICVIIRNTQEKKNQSCQLCPVRSKY